MIILGIETSCDETACGIVDTDLKVYANELYSQIDEHQEFGGVVPEIAARAHLEKIQPIVHAALEKATLKPSDIDAIAYTRGPGLMGPLLVGASFARGMARDLERPAWGINHLEGHMAAAYLSHPELKPPFLCLTVSGGHTELLRVDPDFQFRVLGRTRDDAAGEAFDKCGKLLGLGYPAGASIGKLAEQGNRKFHRFPRALRQKDNYDFSFSGLKTSVLRYVEAATPDFIHENLNDICASLETAIADILVEKAIHALKTEKLPAIVLCGGVSANRYLRTQLAQSAQKAGANFYAPDFEYCTDNGAMIACAAALRVRNGGISVENTVKPWLPLN